MSNNQGGGNQNMGGFGASAQGNSGGSGFAGGAHFDFSNTSTHPHGPAPPSQYGSATGSSTQNQPGFTGFGATAPGGSFGAAPGGSFGTAPSGFGGSFGSGFGQASAATPSAGTTQRQSVSFQPSGHGTGVPEASASGSTQSAFGAPTGKPPAGMKIDTTADYDVRPMAHSPREARDVTNNSFATAGPQPTSIETMSKLKMSMPPQEWTEYGDKLGLKLGERLECKSAFDLGADEDYALAREKIAVANEYEQQIPVLRSEAETLYKSGLGKRDKASQVLAELETNHEEVLVYQKVTGREVWCGEDGAAGDVHELLKNCTVRLKAKKLVEVECTPTVAPKSQFFGLHRESRQVAIMFGEYDNEKKEQEKEQKLEAFMEAAIGLQAKLDALSMVQIRHMMEVNTRGAFGGMKMGAVKPCLYVLRWGWFHQHPGFLKRVRIGLLNNDRTLLDDCCDFGDYIQTPDDVKDDELTGKLEVKPFDDLHDPKWVLEQLLFRHEN